MAKVIWPYHGSDLAHDAASATFSAPRAIVFAGSSAWVPLWLLSFYVFIEPWCY